MLLFVLLRLLLLLLPRLTTSFTTPSPPFPPPSSTRLHNNVGGTDDLAAYVNKNKPIDRSFAHILEQNNEWSRSMKATHGSTYFADMVGNHKPEYLWIGCSDARVPANEIMGLGPNKVFVVRNVANLVIGTDFNAMSAIQYAVSVLKIPHIIVCGHYDCGGVRASMTNLDHSPPLENWLRNIRDVYRLHQEELNSVTDPEARHRRLVELNVVEQCINLFKTGVVQKRRVETFLDESSPQTCPRIHACVFDPNDGSLTQLKVDFQKYMDELHEIYDLYKPDSPSPTPTATTTAKEKQLSMNLLKEMRATPNAPDGIPSGPPSPAPQSIFTRIKSKLSRD